MECLACLLAPRTSLALTLILREAWNSALSTGLGDRICWVLTLALTQTPLLILGPSLTFLPPEQGDHLPTLLGYWEGHCLQGALRMKMPREC